MKKTYVPKYQRLEASRVPGYVIIYGLESDTEYCITDRAFDMLFKPFEPASESVANSHGQPKC